MKFRSNQLMSSIILKLIFIGGSILVLLWGSIVGIAQESDQQRGFHHSASYALSDIETINTDNGNLMFHIPLASLPAGRGSSPGFNLNLIYNSKLWESRTQYKVLVPEGGWRYQLRYEMQLIDRYGEAYTCPDSRATFRYKMRMIFPDGGVHEFSPLGYYPDGDGFYQIAPNGYIADCTLGSYFSSNTVTYFSTDGTYLKLVFVNGVWTLYFPDGRRITGTNTQRIYDRNNNYTEIQSIPNYNGTGHNADKIVDQLNRSIVIEYDPALKQDYIYTWGVNNVPVTWTVKWKSIFVNKMYYGGPSGSTVNYMNTSLNVIDKIILPSQADSLSYTFGYNPGATNPSYGWGEVSSVQLPSGAQASYAYHNDGLNDQGYSSVIRNRVTRKDLTYGQEYDGTSTPTTESWLYTVGGGVNGADTYLQITGPNGGIIRHYYYHGLDFLDDGPYKIEQPDGTVVEHLYQYNAPVGTPSIILKPNSYIKTEFTTLRDAAGNLSKTSVKDFDLDKNGNITRVVEYDWLPYSTLPRNANGRITGIPVGATPKRVTINEYQSPTPDASDKTTDNPNVYNKPSSPQLRNTLASTEVGDGVLTLARTEFNYDSPTTTGNLTQQTSWDSTRGVLSRPLSSANSISVLSQYDSYGNPTLLTDARGYKTKFIYGSVGNLTDLYPTQISTAFETNIQRTASQGYDLNTGLVTRTTDVNNNVTNETDYDGFGRPIEIRTAANVDGVKSVTRIEYSVVNRRVITYSDLNEAYDGKLISIQHYDQLGRVRLSRQLEDSTEDATDETTGIKVQTRYLIDNSNHVSYRLASNPYLAATSSLAGGESTMGWTRSKSDSGGRVIEVGSFSGSSLPAPWGTNINSTGVMTTAYDANYTTVKDQADKVRRSMIDGLGRLARVDEPDATNNLGSVDAPAQPTSYTYDALSNLRKVVQGRPIGATQGGQERIFQYSSLSRLTSANNPESGTVSYQYDGNGNLIQKTDARPVTTTYDYDALNRITTRSYNDGITPAVTYTYDAAGVAYSGGRLTSVSNSVSLTNYTAYDALGRVKSSQQITDGQTPYTFPEYKYDRAGHLISETYPSGRIVSTGYDGAGRISTAQGQMPGDATAKLYASEFSYTAHGAVRQMKLGNNLWENIIFNERLQPVLIGLGTVQMVTAPQHLNRFRLDYSYGTTANNGNLRQQTISVPDGAGNYVLSKTQFYSYDELNRLSTAEETSSWKQVYNYDAFGNRTFGAGTNIPQPLTNLAINPATNRFDSTTPNQGLIKYDNAGNLTADQMDHKYDYDGENRQIKYDGGAAQYSYDGDGRRVKKVSGNVTSYFVYDAAGQLIAEYSNATPEPGSGGTSYSTPDVLGTPRVITGTDGQVKARHDYLPFGEEIRFDVGGRSADMKYIYGTGSNDSSRQKFTQKERDIETQLDYFGTRYYSSTQGRFTSSDPLLTSAKLLVPQSWNRYTYCNNDPLNLIDPLGLDWGLVGDIPTWYATVEARLKAGVPAFRPENNTFLATNGNWYQLNDDGTMTNVTPLMQRFQNSLLNALTGGMYQTIIRSADEVRTTWDLTIQGVKETSFSISSLYNAWADDQPGSFTDKDMVLGLHEHAYSPEFAGRAMTGTHGSIPRDFPNQANDLLRSIKAKMKSVVDNGGKLRFNLQDVDLDAVYDRHHPRYRSWTSSELRFIYSNPKILANTNFYIYENGQYKQIPTPALNKPGM